jgi:hypothetical protein
MTPASVQLVGMILHGAGVSLLGIIAYQLMDLRSRVVRLEDKLIGVNTEEHDTTETS